jgi:transcriptional regulator with XRE-family HTH domain
VDAEPRTRKKRGRKRGPRKPRKTRGAIEKPAPTSAVSPAQRAVGSFLRATRAARRLTQEQVAELTKTSRWQLSRAAISAIERGQNFPGMEAMLALSNVLYVDPKELIERARLSTTVAVDIAELSYEDLEAKASKFFWDGEFRESLSMYDAMLEKVAIESDDVDAEATARLAILEVRRATALKRAGALLSAIATAERAVALSIDHPAVQAEAYTVLADLQVQRGHLPLANDASARAIDLSKSASPMAQGWAWMVKARVLYLSEAFEEAKQAFLESRRFARSSGDLHHLTHVEGNIGMCWLGQGHHEEAERWLERAVDLARLHDEPALEASWLIELGKIAHAEGRTEEAGRHADSALAIAEPRKQYLTIFRAEWLRHRMRAEGDAPGTASRLERLRELFLLLDQHEGIEEVQEFKKLSRVLAAENRKQTS